MNLRDTLAKAAELGKQGREQAETDAQLERQQLAKSLEQWYRTQLIIELDRLKTVLEKASFEGLTEYEFQLGFGHGLYQSPIFKGICEYLSSEQVSYVDSSYSYKFRGSDEAAEEDVFKVQLMIKW